MYIWYDQALSDGGIFTVRVVTAGVAVNLEVRSQMALTGL